MLQTVEAAHPSEPRRVIVMIADGASVSHYTLARRFKGAPLAVDAIAAGLMQTACANAPITDSAPAATAMACGRKTNARYLGVAPDHVEEALTNPEAPLAGGEPMASVLEAARLDGKAVGLVTTVFLQHATPAGWFAHTRDRNDYDTIAEQMVHARIDVLLGGGWAYMRPLSLGGLRSDTNDLMSTVKASGIRIVTNALELGQAATGRVWGFFAPLDMAYEWDRPTLNPDQPSLTEMTEKALALLDRDPDGFFLMVEGGKIDWAAHANDPVGVIGDVLAFDDAVRVALAYAKAHSNTLLIVTSDHGTGGCSFGARETDDVYAVRPLDDYLAPLRRAPLTGEGLERMAVIARPEEPASWVAGQYGLERLLPDERTAIEEADPGKLNYATGPILSRRAGIGWTTLGHIGDDVPLFAYGPDRPGGMIDNTEVAHASARALGLDLGSAQTRLYQPAEQAFSNLKWSIEHDLNGRPPTLVVRRNDQAWRFPANRNEAIRPDGTLVPLMGLSLYAPPFAATYRTNGVCYVLGRPAGIRRALAGLPPAPEHCISYMRAESNGDTLTVEADPKNPAFAERLLKLYRSKDRGAFREAFYVPRDATALVLDR